MVLRSSICRHNIIMPVKGLINSGTRVKRFVPPSNILLSASRSSSAQATAIGDSSTEELWAALGLSSDGKSKLNGVDEDELDISDVAVVAQNAEEQLPLFQQILVSAHDGLALSWADSILGCGVFLRLVWLPVHYLAEKTFTIANQHAPETIKLQAQLRRAKFRGKKEEIKKAVDELREHFEKNDIPSFGFGFALNIAHCSFICVQTWSVHKLAADVSRHMADEKFLWINNLATPDYELVLPTLAAASMAVYFYHINTRAFLAETKMDHLSHFILILTTLGVFAGAFALMRNLPAATTLCLALNCGLSLLIVSSFRMPVVRRLCRLPAISVYSSEIWSRTHPHLGKAEAFLKRKQDADLRYNETKLKLKMLFTNPKKLREQHKRHSEDLKSKQSQKSN